jgi:hypothetical protein
VSGHSVECRLFGEPITVVGCYEPAERGEREYGTGLGLSPDIPCQFIIEEVLYRGVDIFPVVDQVLSEKIEKIVLEELSNS